MTKKSLKNAFFKTIFAVFLPLQHAKIAKFDDKKQNMFLQKILSFFV